jgi:hypothetical protein
MSQEQTGPGAGLEIHTDLPAMLVAGWSAHGHPGLLTESLGSGPLLALNCVLMGSRPSLRDLQTPVGLVPLSPAAGSQSLCPVATVSL